MLQLLLLIFIAVPIIEITIMLQMGDAIGGWNTILLIIATAVIGALLVKLQGVRNWMAMQQRMLQGQVPELEMVGGLLIFFAGVLLITPGFVTDIIGFALLVTPIRHAFAGRLIGRMQAKGKAAFMRFQFGQGRPGGRSTGPANDANGDVIDGEYTEKREPHAHLGDNDETRNSKK